MTLETFWTGALVFCLVAYVVMDGFDIGVGIVLRRVARSRDERAQALASIGPFWDANEVWLIAAGGTMLLAFPRLLGVAFSGFYLPIIMVVWLLFGRALAIELRHQLHHPLWEDACDFVLGLSSLLLAVFFGAALGNVIRGVDLEDGDFFAPLFTDFDLEGPVGILDVYTVPIALFAAVTLASHGALHLAARTDGALAERSARLAKQLLVAQLALGIVCTIATALVQPQVAHQVTTWPLGVILPLLSLAALASAYALVRRARPIPAFIASSAFIALMLASAAYGIHPYLLPRHGGGGLTAQAAAGHAHSLSVAVYWWIPALLLVLGYFTWVHRRAPRTFHAHAHDGAEEPEDTEKMQLD